jgi:hypothetical protein
MSDFEKSFQKAIAATKKTKLGEKDEYGTLAGTSEKAPHGYGPCPSCGHPNIHLDSSGLLKVHGVIMPRAGAEHPDVHHSGHCPGSGSPPRRPKLDALSRGRANASSRAAANIIAHHRTPDGVEEIHLAPAKVTIYQADSWSGGPVKRFEATAYTFQERKYAQYDHAVWVWFVPKGARKIRQAIDSSKPMTTLILAGWGHPSQAVSGPETRSGDVTTSQWRFSGASPEWSKDFNRMIDAYIAERKPKVLVDYRGKSPY